jgi:copper transport outer membrane protein MctB
VIPLRQHIASLVAVFLALAVGIALGGGLLGGDGGDGGDDEGGTTATSGPTAKPSPATDDRSEFADAFAGEGAARLYADGLNGHAAAILAMPGAQTAQVKALQAQIIAAGGAITGTFALGEGVVDVAQRESIDSLATQLATQLVDPRVEAAAPTYERFGQLVGVALATTQTSSVRADLAAVSVRGSLADAELLTSPQDVRNAPLVLVVLPPGQQGAEASLATRTILSGLVSGVGHNSAGAVVVGDEDSADQGELAALRDSELTGPISTVDGIETTIGQVTAVLAMEATITGTTGSYGASGSDGVVPLP